jgi:mannose-6-phosphate isomerase-like protein (cupin superfamily)
MKTPSAFTALVAGAVLLAASGAAGAADQADVAFIPHDKVQAALDNKADIHLLVADDVIVEGNYRDKAGVPELHTALMDTIYITDGETTMVTGGTMVGGHPTGPGQIRGTSITGGTSYHLVKGDVIVIPANVPHWFKEVPTTVKYYVVKVLKK